MATRSFDPFYIHLDAGRLVPEIVPANYRVILGKSVVLVCVLRAFVAMVDFHASFSLKNRDQHSCSVKAFAVALPLILATSLSTAKKRGGRKR
jgi:hypothetical protein